MFDTNVVVSTLMFGGRLSWLRTAWANGMLTPVICRETVAELLRVLAYPKFRLRPDERDALLADYLPFAETAHLPEREPSLPEVCRDRSDEVFIRLAISTGAEALVTGDRGLLGLRLPVPVLSAAELRRRFVVDDQPKDNH